MLLMSQVCFEIYKLWLINDKYPKRVGSKVGRCRIVKKLLILCNGKYNIQVTIIHTWGQKQLTNIHPDVLEINGSFIWLVCCTITSLGINFDYMIPFEMNDA